MVRAALQDMELYICIVNLTSLVHEMRSFFALSSMSTQWSMIKVFNLLNAEKGLTQPSSLQQKAMCFNLETEWLMLGN